MDNNVTGLVQDADNGTKGDQAIQDSLRNPLIVRKILENFSSPQLLKLSLVNKLWKYEARSVVRQRGNLIANLRSNKRPGDRCETVVAFMSDLPKLRAAPFSGIKFDINYPRGHYVCRFAREDQIPIHAANLLDQLSMKIVSVNISGTWLQFRRCPAFLLAKKVLQQFCEEIEQLELKISVDQGDYAEAVLRACYFPSLKILQVSCSESNVDIENYMRALLSRAPNLKSLHTNWDIRSVLQLLQGTSVEFVYTMPVCAPFDEISDNVISSTTTRFRWMELEYTGPGFSFERFNRIAPILLQVPRTTAVRNMHIDAIFAVHLMGYGTRLENVKILWFDIGRLELIERRILNIVKKFDFTRIFPSLDEVYVVSNNDYVHGFPAEPINAYIERANAVLTEPLLDRAARIKRLCLAYWRPYGEAAQFFVEMFPHIEKLVITVATSIPFGSIWKWLELNELEVDGILLPTTGNLDSVFCGIFPEEVEQLRLKDDEYLKQVNIVPVKPAVTCLRNLRTINLHHKHYSDESFVHDDAPFIFSRMTALLAFARQPGLAVNLKVSARTAPPAMTHLEPYVSVTSDLLRR